MLKIALLTLGIVAFAVLFLCLRIALRSDRTFGSSHISGNKAMRQRGIFCVQSMDAMERRENPRRVKEHKQ